MNQCEYCGSETNTTTTQKAANLLGVSLRRVHQLVEEGRFPNAYKYNGWWRIPLDDLTALDQFRRAS
jgi:excisionase family DNA binding protein